MKIRRQSQLRFRLHAKLVRLINRLENDGNAVMETNGEEHFISEWLAAHAGRTDLVVFDVGANIGEYTQDLLKGAAAGTKMAIHAFEPSSIISKLRAHLGDNTSVTIVPSGLSDAESTMEMYADEDGGKLSTVHVRDRAYYKVVWKPTGKAAFIRADAYIEKHAVKHIDLVKIDVEGHELSVLKGFGRYLDADFIDYIQFEYSEANMDSGTTLFELYAILEKAGFTVAKMMPQYLQIRPYSRGYEHYRYSNWVALSPKALKEEAK